MRRARAAVLRDGGPSHDSSYDPFELAVNVAAAASLVSAAIAFFLAFLSLRFASAPGWKELRWFAVIAASAGAYCLFDLPATTGAPAALVMLAGRFSTVCAAVHLLGWMRYIATLEQRANTRLEIAVIGSMCVLAVLALIPGALLSQSVTYQDFPWLNVTYANPVLSDLGAVASVGLVVSFAIPLTHYAQRWRKGVAGAAAHAIGLGIFTVCGLNDALTASGFVRSPYLVDVGFLAVVLAVGGAMARRFVESARTLEQLSSRLEREVEDRTRDLTRTQQELGTAEKLAAVGRLAAGVAHEINNPTAAIVANLVYLREQIEETELLPADGLDCIQDALTCTDRIAGIVRQLLNAGRLAGETRPRGPVLLSEALTHAVIATKPALGSDVVLVTAVPAGLHALGEGATLEQVLVNVIVNAGQAIQSVKSRGRIEMTARVEGDRIFLRVADDGPGIAEGDRRRLFEPFFTTKALGKGTGLGLAVSRGLMRATGGELSIETTSPSGTTVLIELPFHAPPQEARRASKPASDFPRPRLLIVDDDPSVRAALCRVLRKTYAVDVADGVASALARIKASSFDLVLCDVMMPDGGGPQFLSDLEALRPTLADATIFLTGGATTAASNAFLDDQAKRVLYKPLNTSALRAMVRTLSKRGRSELRAVEPRGSAENARA
ncbi:MAG: ATP-binding protein [Polyangiaceae bacterium]